MSVTSCEAARRYARVLAAPDEAMRQIVELAYAASGGSAKKDDDVIDAELEDANRARSGAPL